MVEKQLQLKSKARHVGIFNFKEIYRLLFEWLSLKDYEVNEKEYKEIIGAAGVKEVDISWEASRPLSDYFKSALTVRFHPLGMSSVEVEIDGVKQKLNKGDLTIEFSCSLWKDYKNNFETNNLTQNLRNWYDKHLIPARIEENEGKVINEMESLVEYTKSLLNLTGTK